MIPLGVLAQRQATSSSTSLTLTDTDFRETSSVVGFTIPSLTIGAASASRSVVVSFAYRASGTVKVPDAVTIGGVAATIDVSLIPTGTRQVALVARALVPTGTTADVMVISAAPGARTFKIATTVYTAPTALTVEDTGTAVTSGSAAAVTAPAGSATIAASIVDAGVVGSTATWSGITENYDQHISGGTSYSSADTDAAGSLTPTPTWVSPTDQVATVAVAYSIGS